MDHLTMIDHLEIMGRDKYNENVHESDIDQFKEIMANYYAMDRMAFDKLMLMRRDVFRLCEQSPDPAGTAIFVNSLLRTTDRVLKIAIENMPDGAAVTKEELQEARDELIFIRAEIVTEHI